MRSGHNNAGAGEGRRDGRAHTRRGLAGVGRLGCACPLKLRLIETPVQLDEERSRVGAGGGRCFVYRPPLASWWTSNTDSEVDLVASWLDSQNDPGRRLKSKTMPRQRSAELDVAESGRSI